MSRQPIHMCRPQRSAMFLLLSGSLLTLNACNPELTNQISGGVVPTAPGDTTFVLAHIANSSSFNVEAVIGFEAPVEFAQPFVVTLFGISPGSGRGTIVSCPVREMGLGDLKDSTFPAITLTSPTTGARITMSGGQFPARLNEGEDFNCGDSVVFTLIDDRTSPSQVSVRVSRIPAETQTGPFSGPDTFRNLQLLLQLVNQPTIPVNTGGVSSR